MPGSTAPQQPRLTRSGIRSIIAQTLLMLASFAVLFWSAGTLFWTNAWILVALVSTYWIVSETVLARVNPETLNARGEVVKTGTKGFDKLGLVVVPLLTICSMVVMGFDAVRFQWSHMPFWLTIVGVAITIPAFITGAWAMTVNKFFEWTARIQKDRKQYVCTTGPYSVIRHPGYSGYIVTKIAYPLILGSWWAFVPEGTLLVIFIIRTALEDRALQKELPGYKDYAQKVRYRLIPFVW